MPLGIGIITYKRPSMLRNCISRIQKYTDVPYMLVVAEDGGKDGTEDLCRYLDITTISGTNRGVCWNKNRALYTLLSVGADPIILLEDDCYPVENNWEDEWISAARIWNHVNYAHPNWPNNWCRGGSGTSKDPWKSWEVTGQATITTAKALSVIGYLDTRFIGYGFGHIEWTSRFCRAGFIDRNFTPCIRGSLVVQDAPTFCNQDDVRRNYHLYSAVSKEALVYKDPWKDDNEKDCFLKEIIKGIQRTPLSVCGRTELVAG